MTRYIKHNTTRHGLSLVELLVVIGVVTVLVGMISVVTVKSIAASKRVTCANNLRQIGELFIGYMNDSNGYFPPLYDGSPADPWYALITDEEKLEDLFRCPEDEHFEYTNRRLSYGLNYDVRDDDGIVWHADSAVDPPPSPDPDPDYSYIALPEVDGGRGTAGNYEPDRYTMGHIVMKSMFILVGDSDEDGIRDYAAAFNTSNERLGGRHDEKANVLFADGSVNQEPAGFRSTVEHDVNTWDFKRGLWTLPHEPDYERPFAETGE